MDKTDNIRQNRQMDKIGYKWAKGQKCAKGQNWIKMDKNAQNAQKGPNSAKRTKLDTKRTKRTKLDKNGHTLDKI